MMACISWLMNTIPAKTISKLSNSGNTVMSQEYFLLSYCLLFIYFFSNPLRPNAYKRVFE